MKNFHSKSIGDTLRNFKTSSQKGLSQECATNLQLRYGLNILEHGVQTRWFHVFARQFKNFLILILFIAATLSFFLGAVLDAMAILAIVLLNGLLGFIQDWKAEAALQSLKKMFQSHCRVIRDGADAGG